MDAVQRWLTLLTLLAAALAALGYLIRAVWRGFTLLQHIHDKVLSELSSNGGESMKDDLHSVARAVGTLQREFEELRTTKQLAHELLQLQLDTLAEEVGARHKKGLPDDPG